MVKDPLKSMVVLLGLSLASCSSASDTRSDFSGHRTIEIAGEARSYLVHAPEGVHPVALILAFHGAGGTGDGLRHSSDIDELAREMNAVVAYPDAGRFNWAEGCRCIGADAYSVEDTLFVASLAQTLTTEFRIESDALFAIGFSQGGLFAQRLACQMSERFRAVAVVGATMAATLAPRCSPIRPVNLIMMLATEDPAAPWRGTQEGDLSFMGAVPALVLWQGANGCLDPYERRDADGVRRYAAQRCPFGAAVELLGVEGGSHSWFIGPALDTRAELVRFFGR